MLLALRVRDARIVELADELDVRPGEMRRASRRLSARGLARWRHAGSRKTTTLDITAAGLACLRALRTAAGFAADEAGGHDGTAEPSRRNER